MNVLRLVRYFPPEDRMAPGPGQGIVALTRAQIRRGHRVAVLSAASPRDPPAPFGFPVRRLFGYGTHLLRTYTATFGASALVEILRRARRGEADFVHTHELDTAFVVRARRRGLPVLVAAHCHGLRRTWRAAGVLGEQERGRGVLGRARVHLDAGVDMVLEREALAGADVVFAVSEQLKGDIVRFIGVPPERVVVTYNGVDVERFRPLPPPEFPGPCILTLGGDARKGIRTVFQVARIFEREGWPGSFLVGGHVADRREAGPNVRFLGFIPHGELPPVYAQCDTYFLPSLAETFGKSIAEAMACRKPVVATAVGGIPEVVTPDAGRLVPPDRPAEMARALHELLEDPDLARRMGEAGRRRVVENFTWDRVAERVDEGYRRALAG